VLAHSASYTTLGSHHKPLGVEIHDERIRGTFRDTGVAPLPCRAQPMVDDRHPHPDVLDTGDRQQGLGRTGGDAREIVAEIARHLVGENYRRAIRMQHDRVMRAGFDTVAALRAAFQKQHLVHSPRRAQPIRPCWRRRRLRRRIHMCGIFLCRLRNREDGIFKKVPAAVCGICSHG